MNAKRLNCNRVQTATFYVNVNTKIIHARQQILKTSKSTLFAKTKHRNEIQFFRTRCALKQYEQFPGNESSYKKK